MQSSLQDLGAHKVPMLSASHMKMPGSDWKRKSGETGLGREAGIDLG